MNMKFNEYKLQEHNMKKKTICSAPILYYRPIVYSVYYIS